MTVYYDKDGNEAKPSMLAVILNYGVMIAMLVIFATAFWLMWPALHARWAGQDTGAQQTEAAPAVTAPTLTAVIRTSQEGAALRQAVPTENVATPPALPAQATAQAVTQPSTLDDAAPASLSPVDLVWVPVPTPTTMLSQAEYDASQASEEVNFLNNAEQGLTEAQKLVKIHEAEQQAQP